MEEKSELTNEEHEDIGAEDEDDDAGDSGPAMEAKSKGKDKGKIKFAAVMQRSEAIIYFGALVEGLKHGQLQFRHGDEHLSLSPSEQVVVEVKASKKGGRERVAFELEWKRSEENLELAG